MELGRRIAAARQQKGLTQEQLAELTNITVRTIQRIESGESMPRSYTLKAITSALELTFQDFSFSRNRAQYNAAISNAASIKEEASKHFLQMVCLSCFSYMVIPFIHFLIPRHLLKQSNEKNPKVIAFARKVIRIQVYWKSAFWFLMLATVAWNILMAAYFNKAWLVNYLVPFFSMYLLNAIIILYSLSKINKTDFRSTEPETIPTPAIFKHIEIP